METYTWTPIYVQGMSLAGSHLLRNATHAMLELFNSPPPVLQKKLNYDEFSHRDVEDLLIRLLEYSCIHRGAQTLLSARDVLGVQAEA